MKTSTQKKLCVLLALTSTLLTTSMASGPQTYLEPFTSIGVWTTANSASISISNNKVSGTMALQSNSKYRCDLKYNATGTTSNNLTLDPTKDIYLAIKFIGTRPSGVLKMELYTGSTWLNTQWVSGTPEGSITTTANNTIYYFRLTKDALYTGSSITVNKLNLIIADATTAPYSYNVDWIATFASVEDITAAKDLKDDGETDADEIVSSVKAENGTKVYLYRSNDKIELNGTSSGEIITVYNFNGIIVAQKVAEPNKTTLNLSKGLYLIKLKDQLFRVIL